MAGKTVVEVTEVCVEPPLLDGARAWVKRLGVFSTFENAARFARQRMDERSGDSGLLYYSLDMILLDIARRVAPTAIFDGDDKLRGMIPGDSEKPWSGRSPDACKYKQGDLVAFVVGDLYRVGVVLALPPSPEEAERLGNVTVGDDVYLVGLLDAEGSPETNEHDHIPRPLLFAVVHEVSAELRAALGKRFERSGWAKAPP